jgi:hypothetical protein
MYGKKTPVLPERSSSLEHLQFDAMQQLTGMPSDKLLSWATFEKYHPTYTFAVTINCEELAKTIYRQLQLNARQLCSGVVLGLESRVVLGQKQAWTLFLKTRSQSFGTVTVVRKMLLLMNFEELSVFPIYSVGWIAILVTLKLKGVQCLCVPAESG